VPVTVCFDASFLMLAAKFHIDIVSETERLLQRQIQLSVPDIVVGELEGLARRPGAAGRDARVALELISTRKIHRVSSVEQSNADKALLEASGHASVIVATADLDLRRMIRDRGKPVIIFREKAKLELDGIEPSYW
jgi:rRNA-processing protein FCF1